MVNFAFGGRQPCDTYHHHMIHKQMKIWVVSKQNAHDMLKWLCYSSKMGGRLPHTSSRLVYDEWSNVECRRFVLIACNRDWHIDNHVVPPNYRYVLRWAAIKHYTDTSYKTCWYLYLASVLCNNVEWKICDIIIEVGRLETPSKFEILVALNKNQEVPTSPKARRRRRRRRRAYHKTSWSTGKTMLWRCLYYIHSVHL